MTSLPDAMLSQAEIQQLLPHRYPFLLVDRVLSFILDTEITAIKNVTINEPFFQGHFPGAPVMPGMLILEGLAQAGGILMSKGLTEPLGNRLFMFTGVERAKFRRPVVPGDQLVLHCLDVKKRTTLCKMRGVAMVDSQIAAEAVLSAALVDRSALPY